VNNRTGKKTAVGLLKTSKVIFWMLVCLSAALGQAPAQEVEAAGEGQGPSLQNRIDFGNAYIMGQSIKSGSVYLLHRKKSDINSMLKVRKDFREEIIEDFSLEDTRIIAQEAEADQKDSR
jgi:hypothetical protein